MGQKDGYFLFWLTQEPMVTLSSENAEEMASGEEARFWADLYQKYTIW